MRQVQGQFLELVPWSFTWVVIQEDGYRSTSHSQWFLLFCNLLKNIGTAHIRKKRFHVSFVSPTMTSFEAAVLEKRDSLEFRSKFVNAARKSNSLKVSMKNKALVHLFLSCSLENRPCDDPWCCDIFTLVTVCFMELYAWQTKDQTLL